MRASAAETKERQANAGAENGAVSIHPFCSWKWYLTNYPHFWLLTIQAA
jgi:hypothetical protein